MILTVAFFPLPSEAVAVMVTVLPMASPRVTFPLSSTDAYRELDDFQIYFPAALAGLQEADSERISPGPAVTVLPVTFIPLRQRVMAVVAG